MELVYKLIDKNGLVFAFLVVGIIMYLSFLISEKLFRKKIPGVALAVFVGLLLALLGSKKGIADIPLFSGMALLGGSMLRDFSVVATAIFLYIIWDQFVHGKAVSNNPWAVPQFFTSTPEFLSGPQYAHSLEWTLASPVPFHSYNTLPVQS